MARGEHLHVVKDCWTLGENRPQKMYLKVSVLLKINHGHTYPINTYMCKFSNKNTTIFRVNKDNKTQLAQCFYIALALFFGHFVISCPSYIILYLCFELAHTYTSMHPLHANFYFIFFYFILSFYFTLHRGIRNTRVIKIPLLARCGFFLELVEPQNNWFLCSSQHNN
jgi:hypothetical protein